MTCTKLLNSRGWLAAMAVVIALLPVQTFAADGPQLSLRRHITTDMQTVALGDIFDGLQGEKVATTVVAYAPQPGRRAIFDAEWLARLAYRMRLQWRPTSRLDRVTVERMSTVVSAEHIIEALNAEIDHRGVEGNFEIELSNRNLLLHIDSSKPPTVEVASISMDARSERFTAIVAIPAGDPRAQRFNVAGRMFATLEVPVPTRALRPSELITLDVLEWRQVRAAAVRNNSAVDAEAIIGLEARRPLRAGVPMRMGDLRQPKTISKGAAVTMVYRSATMLLTATGRAQEAGKKGDIIRVVNPQTRKTIDARILGPDRVEVVTGDQVALAYGELK